MFASKIVIKKADKQKQKTPPPKKRDRRIIQSF